MIVSIWNKLHPVANAGFGFDVVGVAEFAPQGREVDAQILALFFGFRTPDGAQDVRVGEDFPGIEREKAEEVVFGGC